MNISRDNFLRLSSVLGLCYLISFSNQSCTLPRNHTNTIAIQESIKKEDKKQKKEPIPERILSEAINNHKEKLGIEHFGIPKAFFVSSLTNDYSGIYHSSSDSFEVSLESSNYYGVINHELGHYYADKLHEHLGKGNWPIGVSDTNLIFGIKLVSEGIAEYFERAYTNQDDDFKDSDWPSKLEEILRLDYIKLDTNSIKFFYNGGYHLVKPIIEKHGTNGIAYLIQNTPGTNDLINLPEYQKKCLEAISIKR